MGTASTNLLRWKGQARTPAADAQKPAPVSSEDGTASLVTVVVELRPQELPHALVDLHRVVTQAVLHGACRVVVDASRVECLSSTTITALLWAQRRCRARGGGVLLRNPSARSMDLLIRTGLWDVLEVEVGTPRPAGRWSS
jgi:anti-anti-sigma factor